MKKTVSGCSVTVVNEKAVDEVRRSLPKDEVLYDLADFFKVLGDTTRIKILQALFRSELCVCDLSVVLGASQSAVSHQLKILRMSNLVRPRKDGKIVFYSLSDDHVAAILAQGLDHIEE